MSQYFIKSKCRPPKTKLRATAARALYHKRQFSVIRDSAIWSYFMIFVILCTVCISLENISTKKKSASKISVLGFFPTGFCLLGYFDAGFFLAIFFTTVLCPPAFAPLFLNREIN